MHFTRVCFNRIGCSKSENILIREFSRFVFVRVKSLYQNILRCSQREANTFLRDSVSVTKETKWKKEQQRRREGICIQRKEAGGWDRCYSMHSTQEMPEDASIPKVQIFIVKGIVSGISKISLRYRTQEHNLRGNAEKRHRPKNGNRKIRKIDRNWIF